MDTTEKPVEEDKHKPNAVKRTTWRKINEGKSMWKLPKRLSSLRKILQCLQKEKEILEVKHKKNVCFLEAKKIWGSYMGKRIYTSVARRADTPKDKKDTTPEEKLIQFETNDWPKFQEHLNKISLSFTKHQHSNDLGIMRDQML